MTFTCEHCSKPYSGKKWYETHIKNCKKKDCKKMEPKNKQNCTEPKNKRRKSIDPCLRKKIWDIYIGQKTSAKCFCCWKKEITPFTYCNTVQAGHIKSHARGGTDTIGNLLPICRDCNMTMREEHWDEYVARHPHLPLRTYGENPPQKVVWAVTVIQSLGRMYLERKNPHSAWRLEWMKQKTNVSYHIIKTLRPLSLSFDML